MALKSIKDMNVDFYDKKYILINAKQYDKGSRFISVTCYDNGKLVSINNREYDAFIRYKKADEHSVFNKCEIDNKGKIIVELTEQMLITSGICYADLIIVNSGEARLDANTGEVVAIDNASILSTMKFCIDVSESAVENSEVESSYEFDALNELIEESTADYREVILSAKSWAIGGTGLRNDESENNAKYYAELALKNAYGGDSIVTGIKCTNDTNYRNGQVTISAFNVGAVSIDDIATVGEVKNYLGIV